jgi:uncharacterized protein YrrD
MALPDLGEPASYLVLADGLPVFSSDGEQVGVVEHVLAEPDIDIFDGIVLDTSVLPGGHRFADADEVGQIYDKGVVLKADRAGVEALPEPAANPAAMEADPTDEPDSKIEQRLHRAWELLSGKEPKGD